VVLSLRERFIILSGKAPGRNECEHPSNYAH
jgi:hypothetical protein